MTNEQEAAAKCKTVEEYKAAKSLFSTLKAEVSRWAEEYFKLAKLLDNRPEDLSEDYQANIPSAEMFNDVSRRMREIKAKVERLSDHLRGLGLTPF